MNNLYVFLFNIMYCLINVKQGDHTLLKRNVTHDDKNQHQGYVYVFFFLFFFFCILYLFFYLFFSYVLLLLIVIKVKNEFINLVFYLNHIFRINKQQINAHSSGIFFFFTLTLLFYLHTIDIHFFYFCNTHKKASICLFVFFFRYISIVKAIIISHFFVFVIVKLLKASISY